jgi:hypothetical protein
MGNTLLLFRFYRGFAFSCLTITIACAIITWHYGSSVCLSLLLFKLITLSLVYYFVSVGKKKELFFYYNLGFSKNIMFAISFAVDLLLFFAALFLTNSLR